MYLCCQVTSRFNVYECFMDRRTVVGNYVSLNAKYLGTEKYRTESSRVAGAKTL